MMLCSIYKNRPDKCNVDITYEKHDKNTILIEDYYELNYQACKRLKRGTINVFNIVE